MKNDVDDNFKASIKRTNDEFLLSNIKNSFLPPAPNLPKIFFRVRMAITNIFGEDSFYMKELDEIKALYDIDADNRTLGTTLDHNTQYRLRGLVETMQEGLEYRNIASIELASETIAKQTPKSNKIFIVHGHDEGMKQAVARTLEKLSLEPIILHEKPNQGRTIIEKFSDYADVSFAVVLLSPDDLAYPKDTPRQKAMFRARQNVILELGYFLGKLGRAHVTALHTSENDFEIPSDFSGVLFIPFDNSGQWKFDLVKELQACGFDVDANKLTRST